MPAYSQQDFLDLLGRLFPEHWLAPLESPGPGYELLQAFAAVGARLSLAASRAESDAYISSATGGALSSGEVELSRPAAHPDGITVTVLAGTTVRASRGGQRYVTLEDAVFGPADVGPLTVPVRAVARGYEWDVPGEVVAADGAVLPGEVDSPDVLVETPDAGDLTFRVRQVLPTTGGVDAALDLHGRDRGVPRGAGEGDAAYRGRIRALPDNVSPDAVERALQQLLLPYGGGYDVVETWDVAYQTCWDGPAAVIPGSGYDPTCFVYDDPRPPVPFRGRWLDLDDVRGAFFVLLPRFPPLTDYGLAYGPEPSPPVLSPVGNSGAAASLLPVTTPQADVGVEKVRATGLAGMSAASVGRFLTLSGAASPGNNGDSLVTDYVSPTEVLLRLPGASVPDGNNGAISWAESDRVPQEADAPALANPLGRRALCAWDASSAAEGFGYLLGVWDGFDFEARRVYLGVYETLQRLKAAGTSATVELRGE